VTTNCDPVTFTNDRCPWTYVSDRLRHGQTLYEISAKWDNPRRSYCSLNIWPYDLEHVGRVVQYFGTVCTRFKLSQAMRLWNVTIFYANTSYHAMTLIFDLMILNMCDRRRVMWCIHLLNLYVIVRSAAELLTINNRFFVRYRGAPKLPGVIFKTRGTMCTKLGGDNGRSLLYRQFKNGDDILLFSKPQRHKVERCWAIRPKIALLTVPVKFWEGWARCLGRF